MDPGINDSVNIKCMFANILIPENEIQKNICYRRLK
jgi:hypothetical protein